MYAIDQMARKLLSSYGRCFVCPYFVISICIVFFKLTGLLSDGPMYLDLQTPSYAGLFKFQAHFYSDNSACFAVRITFGPEERFFRFFEKTVEEKDPNEHGSPGSPN